MAFSVIFGRIKLILLSICGIFRRALCCFSRRRKHSTSESEILEHVSVISDYSQTPKNQLDRDWNSWDDSPRTVDEHIEQYRQKLAQPPAQNQPEPEPDFFQDMTPKIRPPPKLILSDETVKTTDFSRLEAVSDIPIAILPDLEDWTEADSGGWEELDQASTKQLIREVRKELRVQRQNKTKEEIKVQQQNQRQFAERIASR